MIIIYIGDKKYIIDKKKYIIQVAPQAFHTYVAHNFSSPHILYHKLFGLDQKKKSGNQALKNLYLDTNSNVRNGKKKLNIYQTIILKTPLLHANLRILKTPTTSKCNIIAS